MSSTDVKINDEVVARQISEAIFAFKSRQKLSGSNMEKAVTECCDIVRRDAKANQTPHIKTGRLHNSITQRIESDGMRTEGIVGSAVTYSGYHEFGTSRARAFPYLTPAFLSNLPKMVRLIKKAESDAMRGEEASGA